MARQAYSTDLTDKEWAIIEPYVPQPKSGGRPAEHSRREIVNGMAGRGKVVTSQAKESLPPGRETKGYEAVRRDAPSSMIEGTYSKSKINRHSGAGEK